MDFATWFLLFVAARRTAYRVGGAGYRRPPRRRAKERQEWHDTERLPREREPLPLTLVVARGRALVRQGEPCEAMWIVESGALMATTVTIDGRTLALDVLGSGDALGEPEGVASAVTVRTLRSCRVRPAGRAEAPELLAARAGRAAALACDLAWLDVYGRVERRLNDLAERFGRPVPGGTSIAIKLSQEDLAALTGTTRESVNRALRTLHREGRVRMEARGRYFVRRSSVRTP